MRRKSRSNRRSCKTYPQPRSQGSKFTGSDFNGHVTDFHLGYESGNDVGSYYVQAGPSIFAPDGGEEETKLTGKIGGSIQATERISVYGEVAATFDDVNDYGTKFGVKYNF